MVFVHLIILVSYFHGAYESYLLWSEKATFWSFIPFPSKENKLHLTWCFNSSFSGPFIIKNVQWGLVFFVTTDLPPHKCAPSWKMWHQKAGEECKMWTFRKKTGELSGMPLTTHLCYLCLGRALLPPSFRNLQLVTYLSELQALPRLDSINSKALSHSIILEIT